MDKRNSVPIVTDCLIMSYGAIKNAEKEQIEDSVDIKTKADVDSGKVILNFLKEAEIPCILFSEENEPQIIGDNQEISIVLDDLDGTFNYKTGLGETPCGPCIAVFEGKEPIFNRCLASGFVHLGKENFYLFNGEKTLFCENYFNRSELNPKWKVAHTSGRKSLREGANPNVLIDFYMLDTIGAEVLTALSPVWSGDYRSSAYHMALLARGGADVLVYGDNCLLNKKKKKTGEEFATGYAMIKATGGVMVDWRGNDIGDQEVGMREKKTYHLIVAATPELAREVSGLMLKNKNIFSYMESKGL